MIFGTVIKCLGGLYTVKLDEEFNGENYVNVRGRGSFRHEKLILLAGDRVELEPLENGDFFCKKILDRKNSLIRPPLANLDIIFAVIPCVKPQPDLQIVDKMLSIAEHNGIEPVIIITITERRIAAVVNTSFKESCAVAIKAAESIFLPIFRL